MVILLILALVLQTTLMRSPDGALVYGAITDPAELLRTGLMVQNYDPGTLGIGIGPAWSLAVEAVFYLVLPRWYWQRRLPRAGSRAARAGSRSSSGRPCSC